MKPLISIVMPAYNVEDYIEESIKSVQNQTYKNWELIVVNDGSIDKTQEIVSSMTQKDTRIVLLSQENGGVSKARNRGLDEAKGDYISFLDGDDLWKQNYLSELLAAKGKADLVCCGYERFSDYKINTAVHIPHYNGWILPQIVKKNYLDGNLHICSLMINKELLIKKNIRFTEGCCIGEDTEFIIKVLMAAQVKSVPKSLMLYRIRPGSALQSEWVWQKRLHGIYARERVFNYILQELKTDVRLNKVLLIFTQWAAYAAFKFIWKMIKYDYYEEAITLLMDERFANMLIRIKMRNLCISDYCRYMIIKSKNVIIWRFIAKIKSN